MLFKIKQETPEKELDDEGNAVEFQQRKETTPVRLRPKAITLAKQQRKYPRLFEVQRQQTMNYTRTACKTGVRHFTNTTLTDKLDNYMHILFLLFRFLGMISWYFFG